MGFKTRNKKRKIQREFCNELAGNNRLLKLMPLAAYIALSGLDN
jgi:hypothetical protein